MKPDDLSERLLKLIIKTDLLPEHRMGELLDECEQLSNIMARSIVTARENKVNTVAM